MDDGVAMDVDDMDIDLGLDETVTAIEAEAMQFESQNDAVQISGNDRSSINGASGLQVQDDKVHIRGLDNLTTDDIKSFASEHYAPELTRVEWIDDTSANIQYDSAELTRQALASFTDTLVSDLSSLDLVQLRKAKKISTHSHVDLYIRIAFVTDVKKPRARDASRFYLMNPDQDPRERRQRYDNRRGGIAQGRDRRHGSRSRDEEKETPFDVNLYDDDPDSLAARISQPRTGRGRSASSSHRTSEDRRRDRRASYGRSTELLGQPSKDREGRLGRDRSASPIGDGDGRYGFEENSVQTNSFRRRSTSPARRTNGNMNAGKELLGFGVSHAVRSSSPATKELFPGRSPSINGLSSKELFPNRVPPTNNPSTNELFPTKMSTNHHRRKAAMDAADEHGADLFANRLAGPRLDSPSARPRSRNLEHRITGNNVRSNGNPGTGPELASRINGGPSQSDGFSIRGAATADVSPGFSIRGAAALSNSRVKELFPDRNEGNEGKELFGGRIKGRGGPRRRAEDMFS